MTWTYEYLDASDETAIYWCGVEQGRIDGQIRRWRSGLPLGEARKIIRDSINAAGSDTQKTMLFDFNYGVRKKDE